MKVFVNDKSLIVFRGCRAKDAIRRYCVQCKMQMPEALILTDAWDNTIADDSPLNEGTKIYFKPDLEMQHR